MLRLRMRRGAYTTVSSERSQLSSSPVTCRDFELRPRGGVRRGVLGYSLKRDGRQRDEIFFFCMRRDFDSPCILHRSIVP